MNFITDDPQKRLAWTIGFIKGRSSTGPPGRPRPGRAAPAGRLYRWETGHTSTGRASRGTSHRPARAHSSAGSPGRPLAAGPRGRSRLARRPAGRHHHNRHMACYGPAVMVAAPPYPILVSSQSVSAYPLSACPPSTQSMSIAVARNRYLAAPIAVYTNSDQEPQAH